jgi:hypothetical protein
VVDLKSMAREYTEAGICRLGGYATSPEVQAPVATEAIKILLDRGWGKPKTKGKKKHKHAGADGKGPITVEIVYRPREDRGRRAG